MTAASEITLNEWLQAALCVPLISSPNPQLFWLESCRNSFAWQWDESGLPCLRVPYLTVQSIVLRLLYGFQVVASIATQLRSHVYDYIYLHSYPGAAMDSRMCIYCLLRNKCPPRNVLFFTHSRQGPDFCVQFEFTQNASQITFRCVGWWLLLLFYLFLFSRCLQVVCDNAEMWLLLDVWQNMMYRLSCLFAFLIKHLL